MFYLPTSEVIGERYFIPWYLVEGLCIFVLSPHETKAHFVDVVHDIPGDMGDCSPVDR